MPKMYGVMGTTYDQLRVVMTEQWCMTPILVLPVQKWRMKMR